jgi:hypothetical protein
MSSLATISATSGEELDVTMDSSWDVVDSLEEQVETLAHMSIFGCFHGARELRNSIIGGRGGHDLAIAFDVLRSLDDQGEYEQLRKTIAATISHHQSLPSGTTTTLVGCNEQGIDMLKLVDTLALVSMQYDKGLQYHKLLPHIKTAQRLRELQLDTLVVEDVSPL